MLPFLAHQSIFFILPTALLLFTNFPFCTKKCEGNERKNARINYTLLTFDLIIICAGFKRQIIDNVRSRMETWKELFHAIHPTNRYFASVFYVNRVNFNIHTIFFSFFSRGSLWNLLIDFFQLLLFISTLWSSSEYFAYQTLRSNYWALNFSTVALFPFDDCGKSLKFFYEILKWHWRISHNKNPKMPFFFAFHIFIE